MSTIPLIFLCEGCEILYACLSECLLAKWPNVVKFSLLGDGSHNLELWWCYDKLHTSGFVDDTKGRVVHSVHYWVVGT